MVQKQIIDCVKKVRKYSEITRLEHKFIKNLRSTVLLQISSYTSFIIFLIANETAGVRCVQFQQKLSRENVGRLVVTQSITEGHLDQFPHVRGFRSSGQTMEILPTTANHRSTPSPIFCLPNIWKGNSIHNYMNTQYIFKKY